ncbi:hypothetical protein EMCRGX_G032152 [Ephydatia muelleri]
MLEELQLLYPGRYTLPGKNEIRAEITKLFGRNKATDEDNGGSDQDESENEAKKGRGSTLPKQTLLEMEKQEEQRVSVAVLQIRVSVQVLQIRVSVQVLQIRVSVQVLQIRVSVQVLQIRVSVQVLQIRISVEVLHAGRNKNERKTLAAATSFRDISPTLIPMNVSQIDDAGELQTRLLVGTIVAPSSGLLLIVLMAILVIILFRFYKAKRMKRESITDHYTTKNSHYQNWIRSFARFLLQSLYMNT